MNDYDRKRQAQRQDTCTGILEAAIECIGKNGYAKTSIKDIAAAAGVSHGLIGKYFETKDQLLAEAYRYATIQSYPLTEGDPDLQRRIEIIIERTLELVKTKPSYFDFFMKLIYTADLPEVFLKTRRELFSTAPIYRAFEDWTEARGILEGEPYDYFMLFLRTEYTLIDFYRQLSHLKDNKRVNAGTMLSYITRMIEEDMNRS